MNIFFDALQWLNQLLSAWIAITAFALLLYALAFNLRDRVARTFAVILTCVAIVFVSDAIISVTNKTGDLEFLLRLQWVGIVFLPPSYLHFSDAVLATTGSGSRGWWRWFIRLTYVISLAFLLTLPFGGLVGALVPDGEPAPHLARTFLTWVFTAYYGGGMLLAWRNFWRASQRTVTSTGRRRMKYLLAGALAPALGSYQYLLFGSGVASQFPWLFWLLTTLSNLFVVGLLVVMAYAAAFFGALMPDRVVRRRLFKWLLRGPVTAIIVLAVTTLVRRAGEIWGFAYSALVPIAMVGSLLITEYIITLFAPVWERVLIYNREHNSMQLLQSLQERVLTSTDLHQFLEAVLAAACDRLQASRAFVAVLNGNNLETLVAIPDSDLLNDNASQKMLEVVTANGHDQPIFAWGIYWLVPLHGEVDDEDRMLGLLGVERKADTIDAEHRTALLALAGRAALALEDRQIQQGLFRSLQALSPEVEMLQRMRANARYGGEGILTSPDSSFENGSLTESDLTKWVRDALTHYWGGPRLTESPLLQLHVVQQSSAAHEGNPANALRAVLRTAIDTIRPEGERRFTGEWILYNILEMKFMEGHKVREIATRLAMSEADLYRKQRVAIEAVTNAILEMEQAARES